MEILRDYPQENTARLKFCIVGSRILFNHGVVEFGLRIGRHGIRKPSGGWVRPATKPSGGKVRRVGGLRDPAHRIGKRDGRVGGPGSLSVERFEGLLPSGGRPSGLGCRLTERSTEGLQHLRLNLGRVRPPRDRREGGRRTHVDCASSALWVERLSHLPLCR